LSITKAFYVGNTRNIVTTLPKGLNKDLVSITYKSSDKKVATVTKAGKITAMKAGKVTITTTVSVNGVKKTVILSLTVKDPYIIITNAQKTILKSESYVFLAKAYGISGDISWSVSNSKVATINKKIGKFTAKDNGTTYVYAKVGSVEKKIKVTVK